MAQEPRYRLSAAQQQRQTLDVLRELMLAGMKRKVPTVAWKISACGTKITGSLDDATDESAEAFAAWRNILAQVNGLAVTDRPAAQRDETILRASTEVAGGVTIWLTIPV